MINKTQFNENQFWAIHFAAARIVKKINSRAWSLKAARDVIASGDKNNIGFMTHHTVNPAMLEVLSAAITARRDSTITALETLRKVAGDFAHELYTAEREIQVRIANVRDWAQKHHANETITDGEIRAAITEMGDNSDGTCSQYITAILNKRAPAKATTDGEKNEELNRDYLNDHGVQLPSYTGTGIYNGYKSACAKCDDLKEKIQIESRAMITAESDGQKVAALNHKAQLESFMLQYGAALTRREIIGNAVSFNVPQGDKEYRVTWTIDVYATSYENAAKDVLRSYFREGLECSPEGVAVFEVLRRDRGWEDKSPIVCDLAKLNAGDWE